MSDLKSSGFARVGSVESNRTIKSIQNNSGNRVTMGTGLPRQSEGKVGDITVRAIPTSGFKMYIKTESGWIDVNSMIDQTLVEWKPMDLSGNWSQSTGGYSAAYCKDDFGFVHLRGAIQQNSGSGDEEDDITTLPVGFRPTKNVRVACARSGAQLSLVIQTSGVINFSNGATTGITEHHLDGVSFYAVQKRTATSSSGGSSDAGGGGTL